MSLYTTIIYEPLYNALIWLYNVLPGHDIGIAILALTLILRIIMYPLFSKQIKAQRAMQAIQGEVKALQAKHKDDKQKLAQETMQLYRAKKTNPLSSCLPLLLQLPIWFALYRAFGQGLSSSGFEHLYGFVQNPGTINAMFLGLFNLAAPSIPLAVVVGLVQFWQGKMLLAQRPQPPEVRKNPGAKDEDISAVMSKQMMYLMPVMMVVIGFRLPAGLMLYILFTTLLLGLQQLWLMRKDKQTSDNKQLAADQR